MSIISLLLPKVSALGDKESRVRPTRMSEVQILSGTKICQ